MRLMKIEYVPYCGCFQAGKKETSQSLSKKMMKRFPLKRLPCHLSLFSHMMNLLTVRRRRNPLDHLSLLPLLLQYPPSPAKLMEPA